MKILLAWLASAGVAMGVIITGPPTTGSGGGGGGGADGNWTNVITIQTNATTAEIQAAFNGGGTLWFTPSVYPYVITTNIAITNAVVVVGNNNLIQPAAGVSNFLWDTYTNTVPGGVFIDGLRFDGKVRNAFSTTSNLFSLLNGTPTIYYNPYWSNSSGLRVSSQSGGAITRCQFFGWSGNGLMMVNALANLAHYFPRVEVAQNSFYSNFCGLYLPGSAYETAGFYNNSAPWQAASPEYQPVHQNTFTRNYMGMGGGAANGHIEENMFSDNQIGVHLTASVNSGAHGIYIGNTFNHNNYGFWAESVQLGRFNGNVLLANNNTAFIGSTITECQIEGNWFTGGVIITNNSTGYFSRNGYQGSWSNTFASVITNAIDVCGNRSTSVAGDNDGITCTGTNITGTFTGNGSGLTNIPNTAFDPSSVPPTTNYPSINTNRGATVATGAFLVSQGTNDWFGSPTFVGTFDGSTLTNINSTNTVFHLTTLPTLTTNTLVIKNGETYIDADYNVAVTNIIIAGQRETLVVSNHSASTIAAFVTTASRKIGSVTSNGIQIAAGKFGYFSFDVNSGKWTNYAAAVEP